MKSEWRSGGGVAERGRSGDQPRTRQGAHGREIARMTVVDVLGNGNELTDGTGGSVDAVLGAAIGPYRKSRLK